MFFKNKEHTFVIYNGKVTSPEWLLRKLRLGLGVTLAAPAAVLTKAPAAEQAVRIVLSDGTEHNLANATINGSTVKVAEL